LGDAQIDSVQNRGGCPFPVLGQIAGEQKHGS
jgi:hypothetical protein